MSDTKSLPNSIQDVFDVYAPRVKGMKSSSGIVCGDISEHAAKRIVDRGISLEELEDLIKNAPVVYPGNKLGSTCQQKDGLRLVLGNDNGTIVSVVNL